MNNNVLLKAKQIAREYTLLKESFRTNRPVQELIDSISFHEKNFLIKDGELSQKIFEVTKDSLTETLDSLREAIVSPDLAETSSYIYISPEELQLRTSDNILIIGWHQDIKLTMELIQRSRKVCIGVFDKTEISVARTIFQDHENIAFEPDLQNSNEKLSEFSILVIEARNSKESNKEDQKNIFDFIKNQIETNQKKLQLREELKTSLTILTTKTFFSENLIKIKTVTPSNLDFRPPFIVIKFDPIEQNEIMLSYKGIKSQIRAASLSSIKLREDTLRVKKDVLKTNTKIKCEPIGHHFKSFTSPYIPTAKENGVKYKLLNLSTKEKASILEMGKLDPSFVQESWLKDENKYKPQKIKNNDLVITRTGKHRMNVFLIKDLNEDLYLPNSCFLLRKDDSSSLSADFLFYYLSSKLFFKINPAFKTSRSVPSKELLNLDIPIATDKIQEHFIKTISEAEEELRKARMRKDEKILSLMNDFV